MRIVPVTLIFLLALSSIAQAQNVFKCVANGTTIYSQDPCPQQKSQTCKGPDGHWTTSCSAPSAASVGKAPSNWKPSIGMRKDEVEAAMQAMQMQCDDAVKNSRPGQTDDRHPFPQGEWAACSHPIVNRTITAHRVREQWVFRSLGAGGSKYLYIENGVVTAIND